jgi:hypothetical protein
VSNSREDQAQHLSPEGRQLLQLIRQDFFLLRSAAEKATEAFDSEYHHPDCNIFLPGEPITEDHVARLVGDIEEKVREQVEQVVTLINRVETEVNRLATAFAERISPEEIRRHGYERILFGGKGDWEGPLLEERGNPFGGDYWGARVAIKDEPFSVRVGGTQ